LPSTRSRQNRTTRNVTLTLDNATPALAEHELDMYHAGIANPQFWQGLLAYLGCVSLSFSPLSFAFLFRAPLLYADRDVARASIC
jgi:hypothetical protein